MQATGLRVTKRVWAVIRWVGYNVEKDVGIAKITNIQLRDRRGHPPRTDFTMTISLQLSGSLALCPMYEEPTDMAGEWNVVKI